MGFTFQLNLIIGIYNVYWGSIVNEDRRDRMVVGFTTAYAISAYHDYRWEVESWSLRGVLDKTLGDTVCW